MLFSCYRSCNLYVCVGGGLIFTNFTSYWSALVKRGAKLHTQKHTRLEVHLPEYCWVLVLFFFFFFQLQRIWRQTQGSEFSDEQLIWCSYVSVKPSMHLTYKKNSAPKRYARALHSSHLWTDGVTSGVEIRTLVFFNYYFIIIIFYI